MACKHWQGDARDAPPGAFSSDGLEHRPGHPLRPKTQAGWGGLYLPGLR
jgi:hypothetical protein